LAARRACGRAAEASVSAHVAGDPGHCAVFGFKNAERDFIGIKGLVLVPTTENKASAAVLGDDGKSGHGNYFSFALSGISPAFSKRCSGNRISRSSSMIRRSNRYLAASCNTS